MSEACGLGSSSAPLSPNLLSHPRTGCLSSFSGCRIGVAASAAEAGDDGDGGDDELLGEEGEGAVAGVGLEFLRAVASVLYCLIRAMASFMLPVSSATRGPLA